MRWKLVPVDPTEEMHLAGLGVNRREQYTAMLASAPPASQDEALVEKVAFVLCEYDEENPGTCGCGGRCTNTHAIGQARAVLKLLEADHE